MEFVSLTIVVVVSPDRRLLLLPFPVNATDLPSSVVYADQAGKPLSENTFFVRVCVCSSMLLIFNSTPDVVSYHVRSQRICYHIHSEHSGTDDILPVRNTIRSSFYSKAPHTGILNTWPPRTDIVH